MKDIQVAIPSPRPNMGERLLSKVSLSDLSDFGPLSLEQHAVLEARVNEMVQGIVLLINERVKEWK